MPALVVYIGGAALLVALTACAHPGRSAPHPAPSPIAEPKQVMTDGIVAYGSETDMCIHVVRDMHEVPAGNKLYRHIDEYIITKRCPGVDYYYPRAVKEYSGPTFAKALSKFIAAGGLKDLEKER